MDYMPDDNSRYKDVDYWDERYKTEQCYDWLGDFSNFQHLLEKHVKKEDRILILGCGNSSMSGDMYSAGYCSIANIDYSSVCISTMTARYSNCPGMTWHQMDVRQLCFPSMCFDVILEKATLDAIMVDEKSPWEVSPQTACFIHQALTEGGSAQFVDERRSTAVTTTTESRPLIPCFTACSKQMDVSGNWHQGLWHAVIALASEILHLYLSPCCLVGCLLALCCQSE
ncbi:EEF1A lysine methyltransferase 4 isoform X2 [Echeneis naucrates]|uniref:EEF1A lysine methyltransferase 4 isoform X2 n=1 Tax=Echeneis naucrates TaxID=173247 RepID=UPI0011137ACA|nr:EEF1A lysine methyltransferase 4 isoform X2 [Echeneis naucrates]